MGSREPGPSCGLPRHAQARRGAPDRRSGQAAALDDVVDQAHPRMTMRKLPVAPEGWPFILGPAVVALGLTVLGRRKAALPFVAASLASLGFFRDPDRLAPDVAHAVLSPADGRVTGVDEAVDPFVGPAVRVSIFLSPLDVHVNRAPIAGMVVNTAYTRGRFLAAYDPDAGEVNERCALNLQGD